MVRFLVFTVPGSITPENLEGILNQYPIRVSYYALKMLKEDLGRGLTLTDDGTDYAAYETLLYYALKKGHQKVTPTEPFIFTKDMMEDIMDEVYTAFMKVVPEFFADENIVQEEKKGKFGGKK